MAKRKPDVLEVLDLLGFRPSLPMVFTRLANTITRWEES
jgi:hypothetical protein